MLKIISSILEELMNYYTNDRELDIKVNRDRCQIKIENGIYYYIDKEKAYAFKSVEEILEDKSFIPFLIDDLSEILDKTGLKFDVKLKKEG